MTGEDWSPGARPDQSSLRDIDQPGGGGSRHSETNPSAPDSGPSASADRSPSPLDDSDAPVWMGKTRREYWRRKNRLVEEFIEEFPDAAARPVSVREGTKLREDVTLDHGSTRSRSWSSVLREFLAWYNDYRFMHLRFVSPDGDVVRAPLENSHSPGYADTYYAKIKSLERQLLAEFENPHVTMLTFSGSTASATGEPRCPADHLRDVVDPFGDHVRPALHRSLSHVDEWEYCKVVESHQSGYGHLHVAVFTDGEVTEEDFRPAIDSHLKHCEIAHRDAHDYYSDDPDDRPISVNRIDPDLDLDANADDVDAVSNLGSYIGEYIGQRGDELFDRSLNELAFRSACWSTGTQRVTFSNGAQEFIARDQDDRDDDDLPDDHGWKDGTTAEDIETAVDDPDQSVTDFLVDDGRWSVDGLSVVNPDTAESKRVDVGGSGVTWRAIDGSESLDPPSVQPPTPPQPDLAEW